MLQLNKPLYETTRRCRYVTGKQTKNKLLKTCFDGREQIFAQQLRAVSFLMAVYGCFSQLDMCASNYRFS